jgi:hypothetical protein
MTSDSSQQAEYRARKQAGAVLPLGRPPQSIEHGTRKGERQHRRRGQDPCSECLAGAAAEMSAWRAKRVATGVTQRSQAPG